MDARASLLAFTGVVVVGGAYDGASGVALRMRTGCLSPVRNGLSNKRMQRTRSAPVTVAAALAADPRVRQTCPVKSGGRRGDGPPRLTLATWLGPALTSLGQRDVKVSEPDRNWP